MRCRQTASQTLGREDDDHHVFIHSRLFEKFGFGASESGTRDDVVNVVKMWVIIINGPYPPPRVDLSLCAEKAGATFEGGIAGG